MAVRREPESYTIHPGVAAAGRSQAGVPFRDAVDTEAAAYWDAVFDYASGETGDGAVRTGLVVRAGLAAVPYLIRLRRWAAAGAMLERAFGRDPSRANAAAVLPAIQEIAGHYPEASGVLAMVLGVIDPAAAERQMRAYLDAAVVRGDYRAASVTAGRLAGLCTDSGRLAEALALTGQQAGYTRRAGLGPWTQLADEVRRLQVLNAMGRPTACWPTCGGSATGWRPCPPPPARTRPPPRGTSARRCSAPAATRPAGSAGGRTRSA